MAGDANAGNVAGVAPPPAPNAWGLGASIMPADCGHAANDEFTCLGAPVSAAASAAAAVAAGGGALALVSIDKS